MSDDSGHRQQFRHDVLIIGGGAAGLSLALRLPNNLRVAIITKGDETASSTYHAQGGVSAVLRKDDSYESHIADTLDAGGGLCDKAAVQFTIEHGPDNIHWLTELGVPFTADSHPDGSKSWHLTREGGHSQRRVIHAADATGRALETTLMNHVQHSPHIEMFNHHIAVDLITGKKLGLKHNRCIGAYVLNKNSGHVETFQARYVVLATGGANKVYLYTTNPDGSTGDGIAMAWRAGCQVANMEFMQFHPTCLFHPHAKSFLLTEALRGEGGKLLLPDGTRFMDKFDARGELAPRDIVARAIDHEMKRLGAECLYLDIHFKPAAFITSHFPNIYAKCLQFGIDITKQAMPVVPAAHYTCGGVMVDLNSRTHIENLYAVGETSFTGLHGANRLASNSLLECLVFAEAACNDIKQKTGSKVHWDQIKDWDESRVTDSDEEVVVAHNWDELRRFMWDYVGIVRTDKRLERAKHRIDLLQSEINDYYGNFRITNDLIELRNLAVVADLIIRCAQLRKESRGLHYTLDYPQTDATAHNTVLVPNK